MKKLLFLGALLLALACRAQAQTAPADIVVVRIFDSGASINAIITRGEGKNEKVAFDSGGFDKRLQASSEGYYTLFQKLYQEGYTLQSTFGPGNNGLTTLLFIKKHGQ
ncbi:MAG: hypothetical protein ACRYFK_15390 [Janthinobacterium lividum]